METKICNKCNEEKELTVENFYWRNDNKKFRTTCKKCDHLVRSNYKNNNKDNIKEKNKKYYEDNKIVINEIQKEYRDNNKEKISEAGKQYRDNNEEKIRESGKQYREKNKESIKERQKKYREENKEAINKHQRDRLQNDPSFKLRRSISRSINKTLKNNGGSKNGESCFDYLPYTSEEFRLHIEIGFEDWMNWNNHGIYNSNTWIDNNSSTHTWNLDHIIPLSDLPCQTMDEENFQKAWSLSNLRPLSAKQNILDGVNRTRHNKII